MNEEATTPPLEVMRTWAKYWRERGHTHGHTMEVQTILILIEVLEQQEHRLDALEHNTDLLRQHIPGL
jgi:hypothetical protein